MLQGTYFWTNHKRMPNSTESRVWLVLRWKENANRKCGTHARTLLQSEALDKHARTRL